MEFRPQIYIPEHTHATSQIQLQDSFVPYRDFDPRERLMRPVTRERYLAQGSHYRPAGQASSSQPGIPPSSLNSSTIDTDSRRQAPAGHGAEGAEFGRTSYKSRPPLLTLVTYLHGGLDTNHCIFWSQTCSFIAMRALSS